MLSQCSCCGENFKIVSDEVLFCSSKCEKEHDLFKNIDNVARISQGGSHEWKKMKTKEFLYTSCTNFA